MTLPAVLLCIGLVLIVAELLFPSFGALGLAASLFLIGAIAMAFAESSSMGIAFLVATAILVPGVIVVGFRLLPHSPFGKLFVSRGFTFTDGAAVDRRDEKLAGHDGVAESFLRPAGTARIDGRRVDVVTRGEPIEAGTRIRVLEVEGNRVVVAALDPSSPTVDSNS